MGLEVLDLSGDASKGAPDDTDFAPWLGCRLIHFKRDAQALRVFTRLGIDEILHLLLGDEDNLALLFPTPLGLRHKLNRQEIWIRVFEFTDNLLLDFYKNEIADDGLGLVLKFVVTDHFLVFQTEIGGEAFLEKGITDAECFLGIGVIDVEGIPADFVVVELEVGQTGIVGTGITVGLGLREGCDRATTRSVRTEGTDGLLTRNNILRTHVG